MSDVFVKKIFFDLNVVRHWDGYDFQIAFYIQPLPILFGLFSGLFVGLLVTFYIQLCPANCSAPTIESSVLFSCETSVTCFMLVAILSQV